MKKTPVRSAVVLGITAILMFTGCSELVPQEAKPATENSPHLPIAKPSTTPNTPGADGSDTESEATTAPGSIVKVGEWAYYEYTGTEKHTAVIAARVVRIDKASPEQKNFLVSEVSELTDYSVWILTVEQKKISGQSILFDSDYDAFNSITADHKRARGVEIFGWTECTSQSFTKEFDEDGATITQCFIGATKSGGEKISGIRYAKNGTVYDPHDGNPIIFLE